MKYSKLVFILFTLTLLMVPSSGKNDLGTSSVSDAMVYIDITTAYYADLEGDGLENDVFVGVRLTFEGASTYNFDYYIFLTLPSGAEFGYMFSAATRMEVLNIDNYFWNHATESGWYEVAVYMVLRTGGAQVISESLIFDPPGGSGGADPIGVSIVIY